MNDYPPSGVLFANKKKTKPTSPDYTGNLELSDKVVNDLVSQMERGVEKPKLSLAGWKKQAKKTGDTFLSLRGSEYEERGQYTARPSPAPIEDDIPF
jgi:hypothetical protein|tara:strand:- start:41 stop:331 length:291 start_codon:yes stop_codon:yes gene_type:complete